MSSRSDILARLRGTAVPAVSLPAYPTIPELTQEALVERFRANASAAGSTVISGNLNWSEIISSASPSAHKIYSDGNIDTDKSVMRSFSLPETLSKSHTAELSRTRTSTDNINQPHSVLLDVAVLTSHLAVAENGSIWLTDSVEHRVIPFITEHLIIRLIDYDLVATMADAYDRLDSSLAFCICIAGPSKTADIEQSLVIGAQAARSLTIVLE